MTESAVVGAPSIPQARIARAFSAQLVCRAVGMVASVVSVAMTARYLGPGLYGQLTIAVVFIGMWTSLADLGVGTVIVRRVTSGRGDLERLVRVNSGLSLVYCIPLAALAAGSGVLIYHDTDVRALLVVMSAQLLMMTMTTRFEPVFLTTVRFAAVAASDVTSRLAMLGCIAWLVTSHADIVWFAVAQLIPPALQLVIQGVAASRHISLRPVFSASETADLLRESVAPMGVIVIAILYWRADGVILSLVSTHAEVGIYGLAYTIAFNAVVFSTFFLKSTLSTATELFGRDVSAFADFMRRSVEMMYFLGVPVAVLGAMLAGPLIGLLGDAQFVDGGGPTLALLFVAVALRFVTGTLGQGLFACHQQRFLLRLSVATLAVNIALNVLLAARFGAVGAAAALVCTEVLGLLFASWRLRRHCGYRTPVVFLLRVLGCTAISATVVLTLIGQHVLLAGAAAVAAYLAANAAVGPVNLSKLTSIRRGANDDA
jgi:O-antigen/teichoic acid export membrane protein